MTLEEKQNLRRLLNNTIDSFKAQRHIGSDCEVDDGLPCSCGKDDIINGCEKYLGYLETIWDWQNNYGKT